MTSPRTSRHDLQQLGRQLSERDWTIVRFLHQHRYATTGQLRRMVFREHASQTAGTRACVRVLDRLLTQRILTRLERRVGGVRHGSASFVWCLDVIGDRLTRSTNASRRRVQEPSFAFLTHTLAVTDVHVQLAEAASTGAFQLTTVQVETEAWRPYVAPGGGQRILKPDLMVTISSDAYDDHWYLEVDLGTESLPVLLRKCSAYDEYRRTGRPQTEHGVFPRVLWMLPTPGRVERLSAAIATDPRLPDRLFTSIVQDNLIPTICSPP